MHQPGEYYRSIEIIWIVWAFSLIILAWLTILFLRRVRWVHLRTIFADERGAAYTLSYVMVVPLYITFMCLVVETSLVILAKFGTTYAAFAGVRSAIVHYSNNDLSSASMWAERSAKQAFVPFANGVIEPGANGGGDDEIDLYWRAYQEFVRQNGNQEASERYIRAKYQFTNKYLSASLSPLPDSAPDDEPWLEDLELKVQYLYAFHVPLVGRLLGGEEHQQGKFLYWMVESSATLQSEAPKNDERLLGINYEPWR